MFQRDCSHRAGRGDHGEYAVSSSTARRPNLFHKMCAAIVPAYGNLENDIDMH